jgi:hypothetical protein
MLKIESSKRQEDIFAKFLFLGHARKNQKSAARKHFLIKWGIRFGKKRVLRITIQLSYRKIWRATTIWQKQFFGKTRASRTGFIRGNIKNTHTLFNCQLTRAEFYVLCGRYAVTSIDGKLLFKVILDIFPDFLIRKIILDAKIHRIIIY